MSDISLYCGDAIEVLRTLPPNSVQCCITSPPYFGLRSYLDNGHAEKALEIGTEETPDLYVTRLVEVFREVRRVLRDDGTVWLNLGDSYNSGAQYNAHTGMHKADRYAETQDKQWAGHRPMIDGLKPKDLIGIPWMVAFALRADGWYLRSDIIWHKPNPMPESVTDRPTKSHEYIFLLSKSATYFYDADAIAEDAAMDSGFAKQRLNGIATWGKRDGFMNHNGNQDNNTLWQDTGKRNKRSVWTVPTRGFPEAHFATFPEKLIEPCILAGSKAGDTVLDPFCGSGTTLAVALKYHRNAIGIELNPDYHALAHRRIERTQPTLLEIMP